jgi:peptidoglycan lytic transglycosylase
MDEPLSTGGTYRNAAIIALALLFGAGSQTERMAAQPPPVATPSPAAADADAQAEEAMKPAGYDQLGIASWYGGRHQGRRTASGTRFDIQALTAAHRSLPFGTAVLVENLAIALRISDRGPYVDERIIDLSLAAAQHLGLEGQGVGLVGLTILPPSPPSLVASGR